MKVEEDTCKSDRAREEPTQSHLHINKQIACIKRNKGMQQRERATVFIENAFGSQVSN